MISTFDNWVTGARAEKAIRMCSEQVKTREGQEDLLKEASEGSTIAADYLFIRYRKVISKAFWKYYMGPDKKYWKARLEAGEDRDFASTAYETLVGKADPNPYDTFKPTKFTVETDIIKLFGYYLYRYLQNEAFKIIRSSKKYGMTGNVKKGDDFSVESYHSDADPERGEKVSVGPTYVEEIEMKDTISLFLKKLKRIKPIYYDVFKLRLTGLTVKDVAEKLGVTESTIRNHLASIKVLYTNFVGE